MSGNGAIRHVHTELMPGVELYVHAVVGERSSVIVDTGIAQMRTAVLELAREAGVSRGAGVSQKTGGVDFILLTHAHADHIGCNRAVREASGAKVAAAGAVAWIEDLERHYHEFCRTDALPDSPEQRREIMGLMDGGVPVDLLITEGTRFRLGDEVELCTVALPGHKLEEVAYLETHSRTLISGDLLLALAAPFFHGFQTARGFHASLDKLTGLIESGRVERVLSSHHHPMEGEAALAAIARSRAFLREVEAATLEAATGVEFVTLWERVCAAMDKQLEFRGYAMLEVQVDELVADGRLRREAGTIHRV